jgi:hypothetical protein
MVCSPNRRAEETAQSMAQLLKTGTRHGMQLVQTVWCTSLARNYMCFKNVRGELWYKTTYGYFVITETVTLSD